ncbi:serine/threonine protein kinase [Telmatocola sphagniphila]|uniref:Serine/threonine protein kinase n=1 Tax=Telmatocola sphagniphila TaxID=1123043 RepID=A0A8E6BAZ1_9BACT|nr:serine/threonine-protein kinase [Telmatocola sphagniphila]QVL34401.1 serine/threonine protein kinase [Telmatocola sphagniphila]
MEPHQPTIRLPETAFLNALQRSGLIPLPILGRAFANFSFKQLLTLEPLHLATHLVRLKLLTKYQAMQLLNGRSGGFLLGRYKILEGIRQDRVGIVFLAEEIDSHQKVSVKVIPSNRVSESEAFTTFLNEVKTAAGIHHSSIAQILDLGMLSGTYYVVSELVEAPTLDDLLIREGTLSVNQSVEIAGQVALGLAQAHAVGLLHRDIKPQNIAIYPNHRTKLLDLGLTNLLDDPWQQNTKRINLEEYALEIAHIPPEQTAMVDMDARSDLYSLGSTLYSALTGQAAFPGLALQSMAARQTSDIPAPSKVRPELPPFIDKLIGKLGAVDPNARFNSAMDVVSFVYPHLPAAHWRSLGVSLPRAETRPLSPKLANSKPPQEKPCNELPANRTLFSSIRKLFARSHAE